MAELDIAEEMAYEDGANSVVSGSSKKDAVGDGFTREVQAHAAKASSMIQHVRERAGLLHDLRLEVTNDFMRDFKPRMPESLRWTALGTDVFSISPSSDNATASTLYYASGRVANVDNEWLGYDITPEQLRTLVREKFLEAHIEQTIIMARKHEDRLEVMRRLLEEVNTSRYITPVSVERVIPEDLHHEFSRLLQPYPDPQALKIVVRGLMVGVNEDIQYLHDYRLHLQDMDGDGDAWYQYFRSMTNAERSQYNSLK